MALDAERASVGVVVELNQLTAPPDQHRVLRGQQQARGGSQSLRPVLGMAERCAGPVEGTNALAHVAAAGEKVGQGVVSGDVVHPRSRMACDRED
jgi:hypothetical protein